MREEYYILLRPHCLYIILQIPRKLPVCADSLIHVDLFNFKASWAFGQILSKKSPYTWFLMSCLFHFAAKAVARSDRGVHFRVWGSKVKKSSPLTAHSSKANTPELLIIQPRRLWRHSVMVKKKMWYCITNCYNHSNCHYYHFWVLLSSSSSSRPPTCCNTDSLLYPFKPIKVLMMLIHTLPVSLLQFLLRECVCNPGLSWLVC